MKSQVNTGVIRSIDNCSVGVHKKKSEGGVQLYFFLTFTCTCRAAM